MDNPKDPNVMRAPVLVPFSVVVWLFAACGASLTTAMYVGVVWTTATYKIDANASEVQMLKAWKKEQEAAAFQTQLKVQRLENMFEFQFPAAGRAVPSVSR